MATISEISEVVWRAVSANSADKKHTLEEVTSRARVIFGARMFYNAKEQAREDGFFELPSYLMKTQSGIALKDGVIDISGLSVLKGLSGDDWLVDLTSTNPCDTELVRQSYNQSTIYKGGRYTNGMTPYVIVGKKIMFPQGTDIESFDIVYVPDGSNIKDNVEVPDNIADFVQIKLMEFYGVNVKQDKTNNENPEN